MRRLSDEEKEWLQAKIKEARIERIRRISEQQLPRWPTIEVDSSDEARKWYSALSKELREFSRKKNEETYKFTWERSFHNTITIIVAKSKEKCTVAWKVFNDRTAFKAMVDGSSICGSPILAENGRREITKQDWDKFVELLKETDFWNMPGRKMVRHEFLGKAEMERIGLDGSTWILEGKGGHRYHGVRRWSPIHYDDCHDYCRCCDYLISLTDLEIEHKY